MQNDIPALYWLQEQDELEIYFSGRSSFHHRKLEERPLKSLHSVK